MDFGNYACSRYRTYGCYYRFIGLSLAGNAIGDLFNGGIKVLNVSICNPFVALLCGLVTLFTVIVCSVYGKKMMKMIPFIIGILAGYAVATIFTIISQEVLRHQPCRICS